MANGTVTQYDPGQVILTVNGINITGYASGTFVSVERSVDAFSMSVGSDGEVTRVKSQNLSGTIRVTLVQGSPSNDTLNDLASQDEQSSDAVFAVQLKDNNGTTLAQGSKSWIQKKPTVTFATESENREWALAVASMNYTVGGATAL